MIQSYWNNPIPDESLESEMVWCINMKGMEMHSFSLIRTPSSGLDPDSHTRLWKKPHISWIAKVSWPDTEGLPFCWGLGNKLKKQGPRVPNAVI